MNCHPRPLTAPKVLCRTLLSSRGISHMQVAELSECGYEITPFTVETSATVFEPSPVALIRASALNEFLLDDLEMLGLRSDTLKAIHSFLLGSGLYAAEASRDAMLLAL